MSAHYGNAAFRLSSCSLRGLLLAATFLSAPALYAQSAETRNETNASLSALPAIPADMRAELNELLPQNRLIGKGRLTYFGLQVYDARLWAMPGFQIDNLSTQPFVLELAYLRNFDAVDVADRSIHEMRRSAVISDVQAKTWTAEMLRVFPNLKKGDRVMGVNKPGVGVSYLVNGKPTGEIRDVEFSKLFFGIWLSSKTSEPKLRSALLAGVM